jgi:hypothetical protein
LIEQVSQFQQQINGCPINLADRLWVKTRLDPEQEKLRVSKETGFIVFFSMLQSEWRSL